MLGAKVAEKPDVRERLREEMLRILARDGAAAISARNLARAAGASASSINYHFGGIEHLFCDAQSAAIEQASRWMEERLAPLSTARSLPAAALAPFLVATIDDWCRQAPDLAFAWRECQIAAQRREDTVQLAASWTALWHGFWRRAGAVFGLDEDATDATAIFFDAESFLHLIDWYRSMDHPALTEICSRFVSRLTDRGGHPATPMDWRRLARERAHESVSLTPLLPPVADRISQGILTLIGQEGVTSMTHRRVALHAGVTLGAVSYYFPSRAELLHAAFLAAYHNITRPAGRTEARTDDEPMSPDIFCRRVVETVIDPGPALANVRAIEEVLLAGARHKDFKSIAAYLRYSRGETTIRSMNRIPEMKGRIDELDAAIMSGCIGGIRRSVCGQPLAQQRENAASLMRRLLALFVEEA